jgi:DNA-binding transcriptional MerR regulator
MILWQGKRSLLSVEDLARASGLHAEVVERFARYGVIEPMPESGPGAFYAPSAVERLRCVMRLRRDLGVNLAGAAVILEMREHLQNLQVELERLRRRVGSRS